MAEPAEVIAQRDQIHRVNQAIENLAIENPEIENPEIENPEIENLAIEAPWRENQCAQNLSE